MTSYFAARSDVALEEVCSALRADYGLPVFVFDTHDNWRYARSGDDELHLNVTKASDDCTIETWKPDCPTGVNFQIILTSGVEPAGLLALLSEILDCEVVRYAQIDGPDEVGEDWGNEIGHLLGETITYLKEAKGDDLLTASAIRRYIEQGEAIDMSPLELWDYFAISHPGLPMRAGYAEHEIERIDAVFTSLMEKRYET
jgi:hypothetical protein